MKKMHLDKLPLSLRVEASTHCQLNCPVCPTADGRTKERIGTGFVKFDDYKRLLEDSPSVMHVELSNWGEIFLNPEIKDIIKWSCENGIALTAGNGVNLNHVKPEVLEAVVKYRFIQMTVSLDGATQETYEKYRAKGNLDRVLANVRQINEFKKKYKTPFPIMLWQFIAFGHNQHEVDEAHKLAKEHDMLFYVKLNWRENFSPVTNRELIRKYKKGGVVSRTEYRNKHKENYNQKSLCRQLWDSPQVNFDGKVLGCCTNAWGDFGDMFQDGLKSTVDGDKMRHGKLMVMGKAEPRDDVPCTNCHHYKTMQELDMFLDEKDIKTSFIQGPMHSYLSRHGRGIVRGLKPFDPVAKHLIKVGARVMSSRW